MQNRSKPPCAERCWELWRQDDNGVKAMISSFPDRGSAEAALVRFESTPHKQTYWIEEKTSKERSPAKKPGSPSRRK